MLPIDRPPSPEYKTLSDKSSNQPQSGSDTDSIESEISMRIGSSTKSISPLLKIITPLKKCFYHREKSLNSTTTNKETDQDVRIAEIKVDYQKSIPDKLEWFKNLDRIEDVRVAGPEVARLLSDWGHANYIARIFVSRCIGRFMLQRSMPHYDEKIRIVRAVNSEFIGL